MKQMFGLARDEQLTLLVGLVGSELIPAKHLNGEIRSTSVINPYGAEEKSRWMEWLPGEAERLRDLLARIWPAHFPTR
jgi:hypothetical protein